MLIHIVRMPATPIVLWWFRTLMFTIHNSIHCVTPVFQLSNITVITDTVIIIFIPLLWRWIDILAAKIRHWISTVLAHFVQITFTIAGTRFATVYFRGHDDAFGVYVDVWWRREASRCLLDEHTVDAKHYVAGIRLMMLIIVVDVSSVGAGATSNGRRSRVSNGNDVVYRCVVGIMVWWRRRRRRGLMVMLLTAIASAFVGVVVVVCILVVRQIWAGWMQSEVTQTAVLREGKREEDRCCVWDKVSKEKNATTKNTFLFV